MPARRARLKVRSKRITRQCQVLWRAAFPGEPWPRGWTVEWVGWMRGALGLTCYGSKRVLLSWGDRKKHDWLRTLCHEFVHVKWGHKLRHGDDFERLVESAYRRLWATC